MALRRERAVTRKLRRRDRGADILKFVTRREWSIERNVDHDELKTVDRSTKAILLSPSTALFCHQSENIEVAQPSLFAFENDTHVRDARCVGINPRGDISKNSSGKLAVLLLSSNIATSIISHDKPGKSALIWDRTWFQANKSTRHLESIVSEPNTMDGILIVQVVQNTDRHHDVGISKSRIASKRLCVAKDKRAIAAVSPPSKRNISRIGIEPEILDLRKILQDLSRAAPDVDQLVSHLRPHMVLNKPATHRLCPNGLLKQVVQKRNFQPAQ